LSLVVNLSWFIIPIMLFLIESSVKMAPLGFVVVPDVKIIKASL